HHPVLAIAAVRHLHVDPGLLQGMQSRSSRRGTALRRVESRKALEGRDVLPAHRRDRGHTRPDLLAVQQHRAGATLRKAASEPRAVQVELVVQDVQERRIKAGRHAVREPVHLDLDAVRHPPSNVWSQWDMAPMANQAACWAPHIEDRSRFLLPTMRPNYYS